MFSSETESSWLPYPVSLLGYLTWSDQSSCFVLFFIPWGIKTWSSLPTNYKINNHLFHECFLENCISFLRHIICRVQYKINCKIPCSKIVKNFKSVTVEHDHSGAQSPMKFHKLHVHDSSPDPSVVCLTFFHGEPKKYELNAMLKYIHYITWDF